MAQKGAVAKVRLRTRQKKGAVGRVRLNATAQKKGAVGRVRLRGSGSLTVEAGISATVEPFTVINLQALSSNDGATFVWSQDPTDPFQVTFTAPAPDNGSFRTILTPGTYTGTTLHLSVTASLTGLTDATDTVNFTVRAHGGKWFKVAGVWEARGIV